MDVKWHYFSLLHVVLPQLRLMMPFSYGAGWIYPTHLTGSGKDQTSGGLLIKVGLLSTLTALSIKSDLRCFYFI